jgi:hypothetical protein
MCDHCAIEKRKWVDVVLDIETLFCAEDFSVHVYPAVEAFFVDNAIIVPLVYADYVYADFGIEFMG